MRLVESIFWHFWLNLKEVLDEVSEGPNSGNGMSNHTHWNASVSSHVIKQGEKHGVHTVKGLCHPKMSVTVPSVALVTLQAST